MCTSQFTAFTFVVRYGILYAGHESNAGVGSVRWRRFLDLYGFRFSTKFQNVFVIEMRDSFVFSVVQTALSNFDVYCAYSTEHTFSLLTYMKLSSILPHMRLRFARFG